MEFRFFEETRFKETDIGLIPEDWQVVRLGEICENLKQGRILSTNQINKKGNIPVYGANGIIGYFDESFVPAGKVLVTCRGSTCGEVHVTISDSFVTNNSMILYEKNPLIFNKYLYLCTYGSFTKKIKRRFWSTSNHQRSINKAFNSPPPTS